MFERPNSPIASSSEPVRGSERHYYYLFPDSSGYGYGWIVITIAGHRSVWHDGGMPGVSTLNLTFPDDGVTIIILTNNSQTAMDVVSPYITKLVFPKKGALRPNRSTWLWTSLRPRSYRCCRVHFANSVTLATMAK